MRLSIEEMSRRCRYTPAEDEIIEAWVADPAHHAQFDRIQKGLAELVAQEQPLDPIRLAEVYACPVIFITAMLKSLYVMFVLAARQRIPGYEITTKGRKLLNSESLERYIQQLPEQAEDVR